MRVSYVLRQHQHQHGGDFKRMPMASPNQMHHHPSPPIPNFCGNGFGPWSGAHPERVGFSQGPVGWQGAPPSPSSYHTFSRRSCGWKYQQMLTLISILLAVFLGQGETR